VGLVIVQVELSKPLVEESLVEEVSALAKERPVKALLQISKLVGVATREKHEADHRSAAVDAEWFGTQWTE
jgi:hypothetical protein